MTAGITGMNSHNTRQMAKLGHFYLRELLVCHHFYLMFGLLTRHWRRIKELLEFLYRVVSLDHNWLNWHTGCKIRREAK